jgi:hypothetical protein
MTLTIFIALCLLGCGFMQYVLIRWIRDEQLQAQTRRGECKEQDRKQPQTMTSKKNQANQRQRSNCYKQLVDLEHGTRRFESSLHCSERIAYERIARSLIPRKKGWEEGTCLISGTEQRSGKGTVDGSRRAGWTIHVIQLNGGRTEQSCLTSFSSVRLRCFS